MLCGRGIVVREDMCVWCSRPGAATARLEVAGATALEVASCEAAPAVLAVRRGGLLLQLPLLAAWGNGGLLPGIC